MREGFVRLSEAEDRYRIGECEGCGKLTPHYFPPFFMWKSWERIWRIISRRSSWEQAWMWVVAGKVSSPPQCEHWLSCLLDAFGGKGILIYMVSPRLDEPMWSHCPRPALLDRNWCVGLEILPVVDHYQRGFHWDSCQHQCGWEHFIYSYIWRRF